MLQIYRFLPPPLLENADLKNLDDMDQFLDYVAKARVVQELEEGIVARAIARVFAE